MIFSKDCIWSKNIQRVFRKAKVHFVIFLICDIKCKTKTSLSWKKGVHGHIHVVFMAIKCKYFSIFKESSPLPLVYKTWNCLKELHTFWMRGIHGRNSKKTTLYKNMLVTWCPINEEFVLLKRFRTACYDLCSTSYEFAESWSFLEH